MGQTVRADHPAILPVAAAIRAVTEDPLEQIVMVNDVAHLLIDYDEDERVYGRREFHATLDEMIERRREAGWVYLRDDCDGRAVFAAHILAALNIPWDLEASYWKRHAWVVAQVNGVDYDLLDLRGTAPETDRVSYQLIGHHFVRPSNPPPYFRWRQAWLDRTGGDLEVGKILGMLELDSTAGHWHEHLATDWMKLHPEGAISPVEPRMLTGTMAAFPYGEALHPASSGTTMVAGTEKAHRGSRVLLAAASDAQK